MAYNPNEPRDEHGRWRDVHGIWRGPAGMPSGDKFVRSPFEYDKKSLSGLGTKASLSEPLTKEEINAIKDWSGMGFDGLNQDLRNPNKNSDHYKELFLPRISGLDGAMRKASLDQSVQVYRSMDGDFVKSIPINTKFRDLGFSATSELESAAKKFGWNEPVTFKIDIPKGFKAIPIRAFSHSPHQEEILINRGTKFIRTGKNELRILT